jgi:hypothetical protein
METRFRQRGVFGPLLLIAIGILVLLNNLGYLDWNLWDMLFSLWPLLIIGAGLDLLFGRRGGPWSTLFSAVLAAAVLAGGIWLYAAEKRSSPRLPPTPINQPAQGIDAWSLRLDPSAGRLMLGSGTDPSQLLTGTLFASQRQTPRLDRRDSAGTAEISIEQPGSSSVFMPGISGPLWDLKINPDLPVDLQISMGAGDLNLELAKLDLSALSINLGVGTAHLELPAKPGLVVNYQGGVGSLEVVLPANMPAVITLDTGITARQLPAGFVRQGDVVTSAGYQPGQPHLELNLAQPVGSLAIQLH